jgi:predicted secreted acid phosphatase
MGRKAGKNNMTIEMLKEQKRKRDAVRYILNKDKLKEERDTAVKNAAKITCGCGGHYKDYSKNKYIHVNTKKHKMWEQTQHN